MKVVLLTSNNLRHKYIANCLSGELDLNLIITEEKATSITDTSTYRLEDKEFIDDHFKQRTASEIDFFGTYSFPENIALKELPFKGINSPITENLIKETNPDYIVLFGTSIISESLLKEFPNRFINLHLGLSPYYKGSATNLFPYYYNEPECIGATFHIATPKVDAGAVLNQMRPKIEVDDNLHSIGNKVIQEAGLMLPRILKKLEKQEIKPVLQKGNGRICRIKDLTPMVLRDIYNKFDEGIIADYLDQKNQRDIKKPIIQNI
jgi:folate-dependent phosphoribosylglycinamide formyltransferase PurN